MVLKIQMIIKKGAGEPYNISTIFRGAKKFFIFPCLGQLLMDDSNPNDQDTA